MNTGLRFISLLLCVTATLTSSSSHLQTVRLLSILPYPKPGEPESVQPSYLEGPTLYLASQLAVDLVNNRSDILPDYQLELIRGDGGCDILPQVEQALIEHVVHNENIQGVVGPGCSHSTLALGVLTRRSQLSLLSVSLAGTTALEERQNYPNSFSALDSSQQYVRTVLKMIETQNWKNVAVLYDLSRPFFTSIADELQQSEAKQNSFKLHFTGLLPGDLQNTPLNSLQVQCQPDSHIVVLLASGQLVRDILCLFSQELVDTHMDYLSFQFIIVNHSPESLTQTVNLTYGDKDYNCSSQDIKKCLNGSIILRYRLDALKENRTTSSGLSYNEFSEMYNKSVADYNNLNQSQLTGEPIEPSIWADTYFDATWALILALNNSREDLRERTGLELWQYKYGHENSTDIVRDHLLKVHFEGVSGRFEFNKNTGFVKRLVDIWQFKDGPAQRLAYYNGTTNDIFHGDQVDYSSDSSEFVPIGDPVLGGLLISLILIVTALIVIIHIISLVNRNYPSIRATNPRLYLFAFVGNYLLALGTIFFIIGQLFSFQPQRLCSMKLAASVISNTGAVYFFSALVAIAFQKYRIFVHWIHPGKLVRDVYLRVFVIVVTGMLFVTHTALAIAYPVDPSLNCVSTQGNVESGTVICFEGQTVWMVIIEVCPVFFLSSLAAVLATLSIRHVKMEQFKRQSVLLICYFYFIGVSFWILYYIIEVSTKTVGVGTRVGSSLTFLIISLIFLYFPPIIPILKNFYRSHLKDHGSILHPKARDSVTTYTYTSEEISYPDFENAGKDAIAANADSSHGHDADFSSWERAAKQGGYPSSRHPYSQTQERQVTIKVVEEVRP